MVSELVGTSNVVADDGTIVSRPSNLRASVQSAIASIKTRARGLSDSVRLRQPRKRGTDLNAAHLEQQPSAPESAVTRLPPEVIILILRQCLLRGRLGGFYASNSCAWYAQTARAAWSVRYPHILPIARVCRLWHTAATCLLYEAILLLKPQHCNLLARTLRKNPRLTSLIRTIALPDLGEKLSQRVTDWTWDNPPSVLPARSVLDHILAQCVNLDNVTIPLGDLQAFPDSNSQLPGWYGRQFVAALRYALCPSQDGGSRARHLTIPSGYPHAFPSFRLYPDSDIAHGFANLISLELGMPQLESHLAAIFVEHVTRHSDAGDGDGTSFAANAMSAPVRARQPALPALRRLRIWDTIQRLDTIEQLLSQTLVLESLELSWSSCIDVETGSAMALPFAQRIAPFCGTTLKYLRCVTYNYFGYPVRHGLGDMTTWTNMRWLGIDAQFAIALAEGTEPVHRSSIPPPNLEEICIFVDTHHRVTGTDSPWTRMVGIVSTVRKLRQKWKTPRLHTIELWGELDEVHQPWHAWSVASFMLSHYLDRTGLKLECYAWIQPELVKKMLPQMTTGKRIRKLWKRVGQGS